MHQPSGGGRQGGMPPQTHSPSHSERPIDLKLKVLHPIGTPKAGSWWLLSTMQNRQLAAGTIMDAFAEINNVITTLQTALFSEVGAVAECMLSAGWMSLIMTMWGPRGGGGGVLKGLGAPAETANLLHPHF